MADPSRSSSPSRGSSPSTGTSTTTSTTTGGQGTGNGATQDQTTWWKSAPKLEIPWPPLGEEQSKHEISWDGGPAYQFTAPEKKWPSDGRETLLEKNLDVATPVPGLVLNLAAKAEYGLSIAGGFGFSIKKEGEGQAAKYTVTGNGRVTGKASIAIVGSVGVGAGIPGLSAGVSGNLEGAVEAVLEGSLSVSMTYQNGAWSGSVALPLSFMAAIKVTPSASLYVSVFSYRKELAKLTFGEWTIASAGIQWEPKATRAGGQWKNETKKPKVIGPRWGAPPEVSED
jgi:hypothetical protein